MAIGYHEDWRYPEWIMDILLFRDKSAEESLAFAQSHGWKFYRSLSRFAASFCVDPEFAHTVFVEVCGRHEADDVDHGAHQLVLTVPRGRDDR